MTKGRDFFSLIGITKKDRNEMAGCMVAMFFIPIYLVIDSAPQIGQQYDNSYISEEKNICSSII